MSQQCPVCARLIPESEPDGFVRILLCRCGTQLQICNQLGFLPVVEVFDPPTTQNRIDALAEEILALLESSPTYTREEIEARFDNQVTDSDVLRLHALGISNL